MTILAYCGRELWPVTLTFEGDLDRVKMNQHAKCLDQRSFISKLLRLLSGHTDTAPFVPPGPLKRTVINMIYNNKVPSSITHADDRRGVGFLPPFVCVSVFPHDILKPMQITKLDSDRPMFHDASWKLTHLFCGQKVKGQGHESRKHCRRKSLNSFECWLLLVGFGNTELCLCRNPVCPTMRYDTVY